MPHALATSLVCPQYATCTSHITGVSTISTCTAICTVCQGNNMPHALATVTTECVHNMPHALAGSLVCPQYATLVLVVISWCSTNISTCTMPHQLVCSTMLPQCTSHSHWSCRAQYATCTSQSTGVSTICHMH